MTLLVTEMVIFHMFMDLQTYTAVDGGKVEWYDPADLEKYRCDGMDSSIFPGRGRNKSEVPMKQWSEHGNIALKYYAMAHRRGSVVGPPYVLIGGRLPGPECLRHMLKEEICVHADQCTIGFRKPMNTTNYPALTMDPRVYVSGYEAQNLLEMGYSLLQDGE